jgi:hypothetical protein
MAGPCRPLVPSQNTTASYPSAILAVHLYLSLTFLHRWPIKVLFHSWFGATAKWAAHDGIYLISVSIYQPTRRKQSFRRISIADCSEWFVGVDGSLILIVPLPIWQEQATTTRDESEAFKVRWEKLFVFGRATLKKLLMMRRHECESKEWFISDRYLNWLWLTFASTITLAASLSCVKGSLARFIITC